MNKRKRGGDVDQQSLYGDVCLVCLVYLVYLMMVMMAVTMACTFSAAPWPQGRGVEEVVERAARGTGGARGESALLMHL